MKLSSNGLNSTLKDVKVNVIQRFYDAMVEHRAVIVFNDDVPVEDFVAFCEGLGYEVIINERP